MNNDEEPIKNCRHLSLDNILIFQKLLNGNSKYLDKYNNFSLIFLNMKNVIKILKS